MKISLIIKKNRKKQQLLTTLLDQVKQLDCFSAHNFFYTEYAYHAFELAKTEDNKKTDIVIGVGGDGTLNEVVNGLLHNGETQTIFGYLPLGTANDFSKTAGIVNSVDDFINALKKLTVTKIDIGQVECQINTIVTKKYFINIADTGLGGFIAKKLNADKKTIGGQFAYIKHTLLGFLLFKKKQVSVQLDNFSYSGKLLSAVVSNGKVFGNGLIVSPNAKLNDGYFNITLFGNVSVWDYLKNLPALKKGIKITHPNIFYYKSKSVTIFSKDNLLEAEADGEYVGYGKTTYKISPYSIRLLTIN